MTSITQMVQRERDHYRLIEAERARQAALAVALARAVRHPVPRPREPVANTPWWRRLMGLSAPASAGPTPC